MEVGYGKKGSSAWPSRLSASAQPFTMNRHGGQPPALTSLTSSSSDKPFTPAPSNPLDEHDFLLHNSFSNLTLEDQLQSLIDDSALSAFSFDDSSDFGVDHLLPQYPLAPIQGYCDSLSLAHESLLQQDSKLTSSKVSTESDVLPSSMLQTIPQAPMSGLSATSKPFSPLSHVFPATLDFTRNCVVNNDDSSSGRSLSGNSEPRDCDKSLAGKGKEIINVNSVSCKGSDPLVVEKSELQVTSEDIPNDLNLEHSGSIAGICTKKSSKMLDENDSDLDSPCWQGLKNSRKSPFGVSKSLNSHSPSNELEASSSLNPQAPQFFPSRAKGNVDHFMNNYLGDCISSFAEGEYSNFNSSYKEQQLMNSYKPGSKPPGLSNAAESKPSGWNNATGYRHSNGIHEPGKESTVLKNSINSSALSSPMVKPCLIERVSTSKEMAVTEVNVEDFEDRTKDAVYNSPVNLSVLTLGHVPELSSSGVGTVDCSEILHFLTQSLSKCPNINVAIMVNVIRYLSELLVQNCSNDLNSLNEHEHEMIRHVINNLYVLIKHRVGEKMPLLELAHTGSLNYPDTSTAIHEANMNFQGLVIHHELDSRNDHEWQKSYPHVSTRKMQDICSSSRDVGSMRGNSTIPMQVFRKALKENHQIAEEIHPQALLNLWLEAEGALCSMKYENYILRTKLAMDGCKPDER